MGFSIKAVVVAGAAAATLAVGIMPANAAATFTVTAGAAHNGANVGVTGATTGAPPQVTFKDTTKGTTLTCASAGAKGSVVPGNYANGSSFGNINGNTTTWAGCTGPGGITLIPVGTGIWKLVQTGTNAMGVSNGRISSVKATVSTPDGLTCKFTVKGSVPVSFDNSTQDLSVSNSKSNLTISGVVGCFGLIKDNDKASFLGVYAISANNAANNPIHLTTP